MIISIRDCRSLLRIPLPFLLATALIALPGEVRAQSLLSGGGLGLLSEPLDARARALGGASIGLSGWHLVATDPAAAAGISLPSITATLQPSAVSAEGEGEAGGSRFPALGVSYPFNRHVFTLQFGSFLEQEWEAGVQREIEIAGAPVNVRDRYTSEGGISQARIGWATRIGSTWAVGVNLGTYMGALERHFSRDLDPDGVGPGVESFRVSGRWRASGNTIAAGVNWDPSAVVRVSGAVEWSGDMTLEPVAPTSGGQQRYPMPLTVRGGASFALAPELELVVAASRADWSGIDDRLGGGAARETAWGYAGGVEWSGLDLIDRVLPVRLGYGSRQLPFHFDGEPTSESTFSGGLGWNLVETDQALPVARVNVGLDRGSRSAGVFSEDFWRASISLRLAGG